MERRIHRNRAVRRATLLRASDFQKRESLSSHRDRQRISMADYKQYASPTHRQLQDRLGFLIRWTTRRFNPPFGIKSPDFPPRWVLSKENRRFDLNWKQRNVERG